VKLCKKGDRIKNNFRVGFTQIIFGNISDHLIFLDLFGPLPVSKKFQKLFQKIRRKKLP